MDFEGGGLEAVVGGEGKGETGLAITEDEGVDKDEDENGGDDDDDDDDEGDDDENDDE